MHFHELDDAFGCIGQALLTLHDALKFFLLSLHRLVQLSLTLPFFALDLVLLEFQELLRDAPRRWNQAGSCIDIAAAVLPQHLLRCLNLRVRHPALRRVLWQVKVERALTDAAHSLLSVLLRSLRCSTVAATPLDS